MSTNNNIIIIILDSLRADYSHNYDELMKQNNFIKINDCYTSSPWTVPSHASLFFGLYPINHRIHKRRPLDLSNYVIPNAFRKYMLNNVIKKYGFNTHLISANPYISKYFGYVFDINFEVNKYGPPIYQITPKDLTQIKKIGLNYDALKMIKRLCFSHQFQLLFKLMLNKITRLNWEYNFLFKLFFSKIYNWPTDKGIKKVLNYIKIQKFQNKNFIFINLMEAHPPYLIFEVSTNEYLENLLYNKQIKRSKQKSLPKKYFKCVKYLFTNLQYLFNIFKQKNIFDDSLIVILSDHGTLLGEHNRYFHQIFLYDELISIPFWIKPPKNAKVIYPDDERVASIVNLYNMLLNYLENGILNLKLMYDDYVFAESYGVNINLNMEMKNNNNIRELNQYRLKYLSKMDKLVFNVNKWVIDDYYINNLKTNFDVIKHNIIKFLKNSGVFIINQISEEI